EITGIFTSTTPTFTGGNSDIETYISTMTDGIILLRYIETFSEMRRGITILKMRGTAHDTQIREFFIDHEGMHIGKSFKNVVGIISGNQYHVNQEEIESLNSNRNNS
ncbi:MAG: circadian clock protein KaiC, partial [Promethearchaeota archaeon]